jgi:alpha-tubulin suppressor-like RCC1 family protein
MPCPRPLILLFALATLVACSRDSTDPGGTPASASLTLDTLDYGDTAAVEIIVRDASGAELTGFPVEKFVLTSSDLAIAKIVQDELMVIGTGIGDVTITARYGNVEASATLPVRLGFAAPQKLAVGGYHNCILNSSGAASCWGDNIYGQLGATTNGSAAAPVAVAGGHVFSSIVAGERYTCALEQGIAWCWGYNGAGQLGISGSEWVVDPVEVSGGHTFVQLTAAQDHTCGLVADGTAYCWGLDHVGQLGIGEIRDSSSMPLQVAGTVKFVQISASGGDTCALTRIGKAYCWGDGYYGELGTGDRSNQTSPTAVLDSLTFIRLTGGYSHTCGLDTEGRLICWGINDHGQVGNNSISELELSPVLAYTNVRYSTISHGQYNHLCAIERSDNSLLCWGGNWYGETGDGGNDDVPAPSGASRILARAVGAGFSHTCAVDTDNRVFCWGFNGQGQVGTGVIGDQLIVRSPSEVGGLSGIAF